MGRYRKMHTKFVVAIPPSFDYEEKLECASTINYLNYLHEHGASIIMSTAGTSQFNLLTLDEIHEFNQILVENFKGKCILGVPALSTKAAIDFIERAEKEYMQPNANLMFLYPERYYNEETIFSHFMKLRSYSSQPFYIHGMVMRSGYGGTWDMNANVLTTLYKAEGIIGIKEENSNFKKSYDFVKALPKEMDVIVAGGSMRRHQYLKSAGANAFLSGVGNLFPQIEAKYCEKIDLDKNVAHELDIESTMFDTFMKHGWHRSLRTALRLLDLTCVNDRMPWPRADSKVDLLVAKTIQEIANER